VCEACGARNAHENIVDEEQPRAAAQRMVDPSSNPNPETARPPGRMQMHACAHTPARSTTTEQRAALGSSKVQRTSVFEQSYHCMGPGTRVHRTSPPHTCARFLLAFTDLRREVADSKEPSELSRTRVCPENSRLLQKVRNPECVAHDRAMKTCSDRGGVLSGSTRLLEID
jgi:hypothetical protein